MPPGELDSEITSLLHKEERNVENDGAEKRPRKSYCIPEESFKSWRSYGRALSETPQRFVERLLSRSDERRETDDIRKRSENYMKRTLNWWDLTWFGVGAVVGTGIFVLTGQEAHEDAGPAIVISYAISGLSAMLCVFCYTEFAVEIPVAGGSFAYLRVELGDLAAFIAASNIIFECLVGGAAVARSWTSYLATLLNHDPDDFRIHTNLPSGFNLLDPIAVLILFLAAFFAGLSTRLTSYLNWIASFVNTAVILFIIVAGFANADPSNLTPFLPYGMKGVFKASAVVYFAYTGFEAIATMAEETKNPSTDIPLGLLGSMSAITIIYCLMALSLVMMQNYKDLNVNAAYALAFQSIGWKWAKYLVSLGALKGITTVLLVSAVGQARYVTHIARTHMIPPWFGLVNEKTGTPINATVIMSVATACVALFSSLDVLSSLISISTLLIFMLISIALLVRRYYVPGKTSPRHLSLFIVFIVLIICSSAVTAVYWRITGSSGGWVGYCGSLAVWVLATGGLAVFVPQRREARVWEVPWVPWVPSLSIAINASLMASLDSQSFIRFGMCTVLMLLYYLFFGLHASYDAARELENT